jgi:hypothetical protein
LSAKCQKRTHALQHERTSPVQFLIFERKQKDRLAAVSANGRYHQSAWAL